MSDKDKSTREDKPLRILVYGIEKVGYEFPREGTNEKVSVAGEEPQFRKVLEPILHIEGNIKLVFEGFNTKEEFQNYDGVIMFQGIWAKRGTSSDIYSSREYVYDQQNDELQKRVKQLQQLISKKNGFICFLMGRMEYDDFDLAKTVLGWFGSNHFESINDRSDVSSKRGELISFCERYGVAKTKFSIYSDTDVEILMTTGGYDGYVGLCFGDRAYYLPCHAPEKDIDATKQLFTILGKGIVSLHKKKQQELPEWIAKFSFTKEVSIFEEKQILEQQLLDLQSQLAIYSRYKSILGASSDKLRKNVAFLLSSGFGYEIDETDELREDLKIVKKGKGDSVRVLALIETKGVNANVDREAINQVDSHRDRGGYKDHFPGILIVNTFIKSANSLTKKDKAIDKEQIAHAHKNHVLIMRTIDLLRALDLVIDCVEIKQKFDDILMKEAGWLEVKDGDFVLHQS